MQFIKGSLADFPIVYRDMLLQFPKEELKSKRQLSLLLEKDVYCLYLAKEAEQLVGYALVCPCCDALWLDYIAVLRGHQSKGYGKQMLSALKEICADKTGLYIEIEHGNPAIPNTLRRLSFYRRAGAVSIKKDYLLPSMYGGVPLGLYFIPWGQTFPSREEQAEVIRYVFDTVHSDSPRKEEILQKMGL